MLLSSGKPHDLCLHSSNRDGSDVFVTIPNERTIMEFYVEGRLLLPGTKIRTDGWCYGIAPYKYGLVVGVGTKLEFLDADGNVLRVLQYGVNGLSAFGSPFYLAVTQAYNILVSDALKGCVVCVTPDGKEIFRFVKIDRPNAISNGYFYMYTCTYFANLVPTTQRAYYYVYTSTLLTVWCFSPFVSVFFRHIHVQEYYIYVSFENW